MTGFARHKKMDASMVATASKNIPRRRALRRRLEIRPEPAVQARTGSQMRQLQCSEMGPFTSRHDDGARNNRQLPQLRSPRGASRKPTQACDTFGGEAKALAARSAGAAPQALNKARRESVIERAFLVSLMERLKRLQGCKSASLPTRGIVSPRPTRDAA
jgi:hypothetical protein